jgi:hypothetical protein
MSDENITLTLTGKLSYSGEITLAQAVQVLALLTSDASGSSSGIPLSGVGGARSPLRQDAISPKQALEASGAKTNPEKIVTFAALVCRQSGGDTFTLDDVKPLFKQAREAAPGNLTRDLSVAIQSGWVAEAEDSGEYYLTGKVTNVLDNGFEGLRAGKQAGSRTRSSNSRRPRKPLAVPEIFADTEVSPVIDGLINFHQLKVKRDKYLWAVYAAKLLGAEAVEPAELVWLTDKLGEVILNSDLNANYRGNQKSGYVNKNTQGKVRITPVGEKYIKELKAGNGK